MPVRLSLRRSGGFFRKVDVPAGSRRPLEDKNCIVFATGTIGVIVYVRAFLQWLERC